MTSFAAMFFMMFSHGTDRCMEYTADHFGVHGQICMNDATFSSLGSREFPCVNGVAIKNEDQSLLAVYQCPNGASMVLTGSQRKGDWGTVHLYDHLQREIYSGKLTSVVAVPMK